MQDNMLIQLFLPIITAGLTGLGYTGVSVVSSNQPTQQGVNTPPTVYFFKVSDHRFGSLRRIDYWDSMTSEMVHKEVQDYETTFQISSLVIQNPLVTNSYTASDLVNSVALVLQSSSTLQQLYANDVGIYRITDIRNPYFTDDKDRFEASPSFDFTLTHKQINKTTDPVATSFNYGIYRV